MQLSLVHHYATPSYRSPPLSPTTPLSGRRSGLVPQWCLSLYRQLSECYGYQNVALAFCHFWYHREIQFCAVHFLSLLLSVAYGRVLPVSQTESSYPKNKMQLHALHLWNDSVSLSNKILLSYNFCLELFCLRCMVIVHLLYLLTLEMNSLSTNIICRRCLIIQLVTADMLFHFWTFFNETKSTTWISWDTNTNMCVLVYMQYCFAPIHQEKCLHFNWSTSERLSSLILGPKFEGRCSPNPIFRNELPPSLTLIWVSMVLSLMSTVCTLIRSGKITEPISWHNPEN